MVNHALGNADSNIPDTGPSSSQRSEIEYDTDFQQTQTPLTHMSDSRNFSEMAERSAEKKAVVDQLAAIIQNPSSKIPAEPRSGEVVEKPLDRREGKIRTGLDENTDDAASEEEEDAEPGTPTKTSDVNVPETHSDGDEDPHAVVEEEEPAMVSRSDPLGVHLTLPVTGEPKTPESSLKRPRRESTADGARPAGKIRRTAQEVARLFKTCGEKVRELGKRSWKG